VGGKLLDDPTEIRGGCEWHEHEEGEICELKKGNGILKKRVTWHDTNVKKDSTTEHLNKPGPPDQS